MAQMEHQADGKEAFNGGVISVNTYSAENATAIDISLMLFLK